MKATTGEIVLLDAAELDARLQKLAFEILRRHPQGKLAFAGIRKRGVPLARRIARMLDEHRKDIAIGEVDITSHRDDLHNLEAMLDLDRTQIDVPDLDERCLILFDDVIFTGRTIRAAINEVLDFGRPRKIELAVVADRDGRELPIQPDYCILKASPAAGEYVQVQLREHDQRDGVFMIQKAAKPLPA